MELDIVFSGGRLDRVDARRRDRDWVQSRLAEDRSRVLPVYRGNVLVREGDEPRLAWATNALCDGRETVLLGVAEDVAHFAIDLSDQPDPIEEQGWTDVAAFPELRAIAGRLPPGEAATAAQARHVLDWHSRHRFCPGCGGGTSMEQAGWMRRCKESDCGAEHFPRTDPVVIMLVQHGDRCLLGRQHGWPVPFHSALAGFVEAGETLEEAVHREVLEEAGVHVENVRYLASQPWPFPASLMMGCVADATTTEIAIDDSELEAVDWFERSEVEAALRAPTARLALPPPLAIAHQLIRAWIG
ncbi:MAG: NAD(+) diphosphatase [Myxococcota bacterium]|nr:NAD(+) diphosphatase [Myxococcota bacterium]